jgi:hypothetical protein
MEDLSARYLMGLSPSSMSGGNTTSDDRTITQSAKGSQSVIPIPSRLDVLPQPTLGDQADYMRDKNHEMSGRPEQAHVTNVNDRPDSHPAWTEL